MSFIQTIQQSGQMTSHMASPGNQDTITTIIIILGLIIILLVVGIAVLLYLFYTGKISFSKKLKTRNQEATDQITMDTQSDISKNMELPPVSLNPLERRIIEVVMNGHNVLQSDLPKLVNSSKSKVSEALSSLEEQKLIQRMKAGRTLTIKYIYESKT